MCGSKTKKSQFSTLKNKDAEEEGLKSRLDATLGNQLGADLLQDAFRLAIRQIIGLVVAGRDFDEPLDFDVGNGAHVVL